MNAAQTRPDSPRVGDASPAPARSRVRWLVPVLLAMHFAVGLHTAFNKSVTHDELWHLPVGLLNLQEARFDFDTLNPPLTREWAALPLRLAGVRADSSVTGPAAGLRFVEQHAQDFHAWFVWGRAFNLLLSAAAGLLLAHWALRVAADATGDLRAAEGAAALTALLYATCPNIVAHASLVTPEAGLMLGFVATLYCFWLWTMRPTWGLSIILGIILGLTQATKFTAVLLYPLLPVLWFLFSLAPRRAARGAPAAIPRRSAAVRLLAGIVVSLLVLNAAYLFRGTCQSLNAYAFQSSALRGAGTLLAGMPWLPVPLPHDYLAGLDAQRAIMEGAHPVFLDGQWSVTGFPDYYPKTLLYKLPHVLQGLIVVGAIVTLLGRGRWNWKLQLLVWLPVAGLLGIATTTSMQLGVRYVLPLLPLLMLVAGQAGAKLVTWPRGLRLVAGGLLLLACGASLRHHPHHLAYFNEFAGGPVGGRAHLLDSNLDWGQDLHLVARFMRDRRLETIGLAYFGTVPPELVGIRYTVPPGLTAETAASWSLPAGWYAVSVNYVMGRPHVIREPDGTSHGVGLDEFGYFRALEPVARLGYSIDVYHVTAPLRK